MDRSDWNTELAHLNEIEIQKRMSKGKTNMVVTAISPDTKLKFVNTGKTEYQVETIIDNCRTRWTAKFKTYTDAIEFIKSRDKQSGVKYLVTEISTKTMGVF